MSDKREYHLALDEQQYQDLLDMIETKVIDVYMVSDSPTAIARRLNNIKQQLIEWNKHVRA